MLPLVEMATHRAHELEFEEGIFLPPELQAWGSWNLFALFTTLDDEKEVDAEPIKVSDTDSLLLEFLGDRGKSMFVAMVPHDGSVWFFKMLGDSSVVEREATAFRNFLSSVRLN